MLAKSTRQLNPKFIRISHHPMTDSDQHSLPCDSSVGQIVTNTTMLSPKHITQHCPERRHPHLELRHLMPMDRSGFGTSGA
ncbi:hypothetical protein BLNAU_9834 [Blattamonas nauphoetae]|uniref:Uncharacterized protein n=1 Tax=Blattamonas nauphoetae TaxID=2049346 RepID=A0ABQ9XUX2_9EUKA|nr:hypothetical protein BLNAU_9834 [Blattamonas nauphoetae]